MQIDPILGFATLESTILSPPRGQWSLFSKAKENPLFSLWQWSKLLHSNINVRPLLSLKKKAVKEIGNLFLGASMLRKFRLLSSGFQTCPAFKPADAYNRNLGIFRCWQWNSLWLLENFWMLLFYYFFFLMWQVTTLEVFSNLNDSMIP